MISKLDLPKGQGHSEKQKIPRKQKHATSTKIEQ